MITIAGLREDFPLTLLAGESAAGHPIRWVHISEHEDPAPWLSGGELVLTTGYKLDTEDKQRRFVESLAGQNAAGLGFGTGFDHDEVPPAMIETAGELDFPLFQVPYSVPFIAISEKASVGLINDQFKILERGSKVQGQLELQLIEGAGLKTIVTSIADSVSGRVFVFDRAGRVVTGSGEPEFEVEVVGAELKKRSEQRRRIPYETDALREGSLAVPIPGSEGDQTAGWLVVVADRREPLGQFETLMARLSSTVVGLGMMRMRAVRETERRLAGGLLADAIHGKGDPADVARRLRSFGLGSTIAVLVFDADAPDLAEASLEGCLEKRSIAAMIATTEDASGKPLVCAVVDASDAEPVELATELHGEIGADQAKCRAAASRPSPDHALRRAFHEARCALEASSMGSDPRPVGSYSDLGAFTLLLSVQDDEALRQFSGAVLGGIEAGDDPQAEELMRSLEAFIECNGNWERAAKRLYCHRHTLRHRITKIEEMTGRDFHRATDRIECWLALQARQMID
ncbi:MAG: PucR family transcriptional regulator ligand-binding domain-containing protein [Solirubrobacterales bacterium]|nr:PucR family transcriptional regulator ligand-binding domain-containing protein [Solirubrobacterales bacterium]